MISKSCAGTANLKLPYLHVALLSEYAPDNATIIISFANSPLIVCVHKIIYLVCILLQNDQEKSRYKLLFETVGWFFFDLLLLGYVEDTVTGKSFYLPRGLSWSIFIEVITKLSLLNVVLKSVSFN